MYNLTVDEAHTFYVGDGQWLVHNCDLSKYSQPLQGGLEILRARAPKYFDLLDNGKIKLSEEGIGLLSGGFPKNDTFFMISNHNPASNASTLYEEIYHMYQGKMLKLDAETEAMIATAEWVQRNDLVKYLNRNEGGEELYIVYLEHGENALRKRLVNHSKYKETIMLSKVEGYLYKLKRLNPYGR